jgi:hypothetical protein
LWYVICKILFLKLVFFLLKIGWDPIHFNDLLRSSSRISEICLLVKKMPRHNDDEIYTKRLADLGPHPRRTRTRGALERIKQAEDNRTRLLEQEGYEGRFFSLLFFSNPFYQSS